MSERSSMRLKDCGSLCVALLLVFAACITVVTSCGGGSSSDGGLCEQCGNDPDGPCQPSVEVKRAPDAPAPCNVPGPEPCTVKLTCLRKLGSAQRRCFPYESDPQFRCDGERANPSTQVPQPTTTPTETSAPTTTTTVSPGT